MSASLRRRTSVLIALAIAFLAGTSCRTSLNADELIANTLSGREGEIRGSLKPGLSEEEKTSFARYAAAFEPLAADALRVLDEAAALQLATRTNAGQVAGQYRELAGRARDLAERLRQLNPPPALAAAHADLVAAYDGHAAVAGAYAEAFANLDFPALRRLRPEHDAAQVRLLAAHDRLAQDSAPLFQPGKHLRLPGRT